MRVLLTGANGFVGGHLLAGLRARGHIVVAAVRDPVKLRRKVPGVEAIAADFNRDTTSQAWQSRLVGVDAVVNCAGVLHGGRGQNIEAIHATAPIALFDACVEAGVRKVVQSSAISADAEVGTAYALTKRRADDHLRSLALDWTVLRPSLIYAEGSYGGTSTLRGLAGLPLVTPVIGGGSASFRPLHVDDLVETVVRIVEGRIAPCCTVEPVGPEVLTLGQIIEKYRRWLGLPPALVLPLPLLLMRVVAGLADLAGGGPVGSASLNQLLAGNVGRQPAEQFAKEAGFSPRSLDESLARHPAQTQDLWHARLYFARPLLRFVLAFLWLGSAFVGFPAPVGRFAEIDAALAGLGLSSARLAFLFSTVDLVIGLGLLFRLWPRVLALAQLLVVGGYTLGLTLLVPALWLDPFGTLLKNLPILAAILVWAALEEKR